MLFSVRWKGIQTRAEAALSPLSPGCGPRGVEHITPTQHEVMGAQRRAVPGWKSVFSHLAQLRMQRGLVRTGSLSSCSNLRISLSLRDCKMHPQIFAVKWS